LTDFLNTAQFSYVFPDLRGYGSRRDEAGASTVAEAAADAFGLADALGWDRFSLVGHSMGGVAMQHVLLQAPYRVRRLVGVAPGPAGGPGLREAAWAPVGSGRRPGAAAGRPWPRPRRAACRSASRNGPCSPPPPPAPPVAR